VEKYKNSSIPKVGETGNIEGIAHKEFIAAGQTVNSTYNCDVLQRVRRLHPELWQQMNWLLNYDKTPSHTSFYTREFFTKNNMIVNPHPPYSPRLAPCDVFLFP
jgi:hypothetical protein